MTNEETTQKIREHLGRVRSSALMMANAQSATDRNRYLQTLAKELQKALALLDTFTPG